MMLRRGAWDLPKGHIEPGESERAAAAREVCEECGLDPALLAVGGEIARTVHLSAADEEKHTVWFRMDYSGDPARVAPQTEEEITALEWIVPDEARRRAAGSFDTIRTVIEKLITGI
jgi:8-oxo-dGTP pyrophosphatase MutT (NUDIX family)